MSGIKRFFSPLLVSLSLILSVSAIYASQCPEYASDAKSQGWSQVSGGTKDASYSKVCAGDSTIYCFYYSPSAGSMVFKKSGSLSGIGWVSTGCVGVNVPNKCFTKYCNFNLN